MVVVEARLLGSILVNVTSKPSKLAEISGYDRQTLTACVTSNQQIIAAGHLSLPFEVILDLGSVPGGTRVEGEDFEPGRKIFYPAMGDTSTRMETVSDVNSLETPPVTCKLRFI